MEQLVVRPAESPKGEFWEAVELLKVVLSDKSATFIQVVQEYMRVLDLLDQVPVEKPVYGAERAVHDWRSAPAVVVRSE